MDRESGDLIQKEHKRDILTMSTDDSHDRAKIEREILDSLVAKKIKKRENKKQHEKWRNTTACSWSTFFLIMLVYNFVVIFAVVLAWDFGVVLGTSMKDIIIGLFGMGIIPALMLQSHMEF